MSRQTFIVGEIDFHTEAHNLMVELITLQHKNWENPPKCQTHSENQKMNFNVQAGYASGYISCLRQLLICSRGLPNTRVQQLSECLNQAINDIDEMLEIENEDGSGITMQMNLEASEDAEENSTLLM